MKISGRNGWQLEIDLNGGRIVGLAKDDQKILGTFDRIDGKRGNTHICLPNFANEGVEKFGFVFHGPFRNAGWSLISQQENGWEIKCEIDGLFVAQKLLVDDGFKQIIEIENKSEERKRVNMAMHNYWDTEFGWQGTRLNSRDISNDFKASSEIKLEKENILEFPGKKPVKWKVENFKLAKLWTAVKEIGEKKVYDREYVCIEPEMEFEGFVETDNSWLEMKEKIVLSQEINIF